MKTSTIRIVPAEKEHSASLDVLRFSEYLGLHLDFYRCILVQITLKCPLECEHCCVDASPRRRETIDANDLIVGIHSFGGLSSADLVCFTGGEPFSERRLLRSALTACVELGLRTYVITAAHWATSVSTAKSVLESLPKIDLISISTDVFHKKFVSLKNIRYAIQAAVDLNISVNLLLTIDGNFGEFESEIQGELAEFWDGLDVFKTPLGAVGRSVDSVEVDQGFLSNVDGPCQLLGTPAVTASGSVCACCQVNETNRIDESSHALNLGKIGRDTFSSMQAKLDSDPLLKAIKIVGPKWIIRGAQKHSILPVINNLEGMSVCRACSIIVRDAEVSRSLRAFLALPAIKAQIDFLEGVVNGG